MNLFANLHIAYSSAMTVFSLTIKWSKNDKLINIERDENQSGVQ